MQEVRDVGRKFFYQHKISIVFAYIAHNSCGDRHDSFNMPHFRLVMRVNVVDVPANLRRPPQNPTHPQNELVRKILHWPKGNLPSYRGR